MFFKRLTKVRLAFDADLIASFLEAQLHKTLGLSDLQNIYFLALRQG